MGTGGAGTAGRVEIQFSDPNGVVLRAEWQTLTAALNSQGIATS
jgi:hypothetical protein